MNVCHMVTLLPSWQWEGISPSEGGRVNPEGSHSMALKPDLKKSEIWNIAMEMGAFSGRAQQRG